jgi:hypothetical protein
MRSRTYYELLEPFRFEPRPAVAKPRRDAHLGSATRGATLRLQVTKTDDTLIGLCRGLAPQNKMAPQNTNSRCLPPLT